MECFKIRLPEESTLVGVTAGGEPAQVYPGEYLVHLLKAKAPSMAPAMLRFVGADPTGRDVHVPFPSTDTPPEVSRLLARVEALGA